MYTYGYLREAVIAHCDLEEEELQAMNVLKRLHIFANEAMQAVCACKPKYKYFKIKAVKKYRPLIREIINHVITYTELPDSINELGTFATIDEASTHYPANKKYVNMYVFITSTNTYNA